jgi:hypothetical protein
MAEKSKQPTTAVRPVKLRAVQYKITNPDNGVVYTQHTDTPLLDLNSPEAHFERVQVDAGVLQITGEG